MKQFNYHDHFDRLTIRQEFIKDTSHVEEDYILKFVKIADITGDIAFQKYRVNYSRAGFSLEDVQAISRIYLVGYLANYGMRYNKESREALLQKVMRNKKKEPTPTELYKVERNQIITFLRQKLHHCSVVCERKSRNIVVGRNERKFYRKTKNAVEVDDRLILDNHKKFGYEKITIQEFKDAQKIAREKGEEKITDKDGMELVVAQYLDPGMLATEYVKLVESYDTIYTSNPEQYLMKMEKERQDEKNMEFFESLSQHGRVKIFKSFIKKNASNLQMKEEVTNARQLIKRYSFWDGY